MFLAQRDATKATGMPASEYLTAKDDLELNLIALIKAHRQGGGGDGEEKTPDPADEPMEEANEYDAEAAAAEETARFAAEEEAARIASEAATAEEAAAEEAALPPPNLLRQPRQKTRLILEMTGRHTEPTISYYPCRH